MILRCLTSLSVVRVGEPYRGRCDPSPLRSLQSGPRPRRYRDPHPHRPGSCRDPLSGPAPCLDPVGSSNSPWASRPFSVVVGPPLFPHFPTTVAPCLRTPVLSVSGLNPVPPLLFNRTPNTRPPSFPLPLLPSFPPSSHRPLTPLLPPPLPPSLLVDHRWGPG